MASPSSGGWSAKLRSENLPLAVALQGLALCTLALLTGPPTPAHDSEPGVAGAAWRGDTISASLTSEVPTDLNPEQLRLPRFPDPKERFEKRQPAAADETSQMGAGATSTLQALRTDTVSYRGPAMVQVTLSLPGAPEQLVPGALSARRFGEGSGRPGRRGERGWGGIGGIGGIGIGDMGGDGPRCHPRRPGFLHNPRRPRNPRNPITDPPLVTGHLQ